MMKNAETTPTHSDWMRAHEVKRAALILGLIPDYGKGNCLQVQKILKEQIAKGRVQKRKAGSAQSAAASYRVVFTKRERKLFERHSVARN